MKVSIYISAVISLLSIVVGLFLFKLHHLPATGVILSFAAFFNALIFLPLLAFYLFQKKLASVSLHMFGLLTWFILSFGAIFKFQQWPGALEISTAGVVLFCVFVVMEAVELYKRDL